MRTIKKRKDGNCQRANPPEQEREERSTPALISPHDKRKVKVCKKLPCLDDANLEDLKKRVTTLECRVRTLEDPPAVPPGYIRASEFFRILRMKRRA